MGSMRGGGTQTTVQRADPWVGQQPSLYFKFGEARRLYDTAQPQYYPGQTVARPTLAQIQGQDMALDTARSLAPTLANARTGVDFLSNPALLSPDSNPYLAATADAAARPVLRAFNEQLLPSIRQDAIVAGNLGNDRQGVAEGVAIRDTNQILADQSAQIYSDAYNKGLDSMVRGIALAPATAQAQLLPSSIFSTVGAEQQGQSQAQIDADIDRWNYNQNLPWQMLSNYDAIISGNYGGTQSTNQTARQNSLTSAIQGGLGGAALGSMVQGFGGSLLTGGGGALLGPAGWIGMGLGALGGLFG